jgi:hypothetical protein
MVRSCLSRRSGQITGSSGSVHAGLALPLSHATTGSISVADAYQSRTWDLHLQPRLTSTAACELQLLLHALELVRLSSAYADRRAICCLTPGVSTSPPVIICPTHDHAKELRATAAPPKCRHFLWLLHRERLPTRDLLHRRHIAPNGLGPFCTQPETQVHPPTLSELGTLLSNQSHALQHLEEVQC